MKEKVKILLNKLSSMIKKYRFLIAIFIVLCFGYVYNVYGNRTYDNAENDVKHTQPMDTNEPATIMINTGLYNKSTEEKREFLLRDHSMDNLLGNEKARISIIEYSSFTCMYCKRMRNTINKIIEEYVFDKKVANYVIRPLYKVKTIPFGNFIQCSRKEDKQKITDVLFETDVEKISDMEQFLINLGNRFNMNEEYVKNCIYDKDMYQKLIYLQQEAKDVFDLRATPVIIINGKEYIGFRTYKQLKEIIDKELEGKKI